MQARLLRAAGRLAATALVGATLVAGAGPAAAAEDGRTFVGTTTVRSDDGKVLPARTYRLPDGGTETVVDRAALTKLVDAAAQRAAGCGYQCDGKDPASFWVPLPGHDAYLCGDDAVTVLTRSGYATVELRYSPRCRTAWTRGRAYTNYAGFGYYSNGAYRNAVYGYGRNTPNSVYTAMLNDAGLLYKACFDNQIGGSPEWVCTGLY